MSIVGLQISLSLIVLHNINHDCPSNGLEIYFLASHHHRAYFIYIQREREHICNPTIDINQFSDFKLCLIMLFFFEEMDIYPLFWQHNKEQKIKTNLRHLEKEKKCTKVLIFPHYYAGQQDYNFKKMLKVIFIPYNLKPHISYAFITGSKHDQIKFFFL